MPARQIVKSGQLFTRPGVLPCGTNSPEIVSVRYLPVPLVRCHRAYRELLSKLKNLKKINSYNKFISRRGDPRRFLRTCLLSFNDLKVI